MEGQTDYFLIDPATLIECSAQLIDLTDYQRTQVVEVMKHYLELAKLEWFEQLENHVICNEDEWSRNPQGAFKWFKPSFNPSKHGQ